MKTHQAIYRDNSWSTPLPSSDKTQIVLAFGNREIYSSQAFRSELRTHFSNADIIGCTTSGEVLGDQVHDNSICLSALHFEYSSVSVSSNSIHKFNNARDLAGDLSRELMNSDTEIKAVIVLSDGQLVNGSDLVSGFSEHLPSHVSVSGGLAGDGDRFQETIVWHNETCEPGLVVAIGLSGERLHVGHGHLGGWKPFGSERIITKSTQNVLFEFDNEPALSLYKQFLGDQAAELPGSALRFPIAMRTDDQSEEVVRTILSINEEENSMTFAGNMPEGSRCQLMRANFEDLVDGAQTAADKALTTLNTETTDFALLISCVGRRLVLNQRVEEELEAVQEVFPNTAIGGFYSYGEISPIVELGKCSLHNQTMTLTTLTEK